MKLRNKNGCNGSELSELWLRIWTCWLWFRSYLLVWNARFRLTGKSDCNSSFSRIYQGERPFPKQHKSLFHSLSLNSRVSFTIVMLFESFLWRNRHKYSLIKRGAFWLVAPVFGNPVATTWHIRSIPDPYIMRRGGHQLSSFRNNFGGDLWNFKSLPTPRPVIDIENGRLHQLQTDSACFRVNLNLKTIISSNHLQNSFLLAKATIFRHLIDCRGILYFWKYLQAGT